MKNYNFCDIYNNFNYTEIDFENPINTLIKINNLFIEDGLRENRDKEINKLREEIIKTLNINNNHLDLYSITRCISLMQFWQIFYDANHRTSILFFKMLMNYYEPNFNFIANPNNSFDNFFSIYYSDSDKTSKNCINEIKKYIKK